MLFTQFEFLPFFLLLLGFSWLVKSARARKLALLAASYYFYAYWDWRFCSLILLSTVIDFVLARGMPHASPRRRRGLMVASIVANLGLLGFFKYAGFFAESFSAVFGALLPFRLDTLRHIILPVGISFYTFQTLSYTIDVYRRRLEPCEDFFDYALFVAFFPQLVAGPIVRAAHFLPQLKRPREIDRARLAAGFSQFTAGLFKKLFIADRLAVFVDTVFSGPQAFDGLTSWLAVLCYAVQIYCDFSGYSDMAIGLARMLGFDLLENFDHPYTATSLTAFWKRWHVSLSSWLRDYLYIPLGGSRGRPGRNVFNVMTTMVLGGLWHGAAWTFVLWGTLHGVALVFERWSRPELEALRLPPRLARTAGWLWTMTVVGFGWALFRSESVVAALRLWKQLALGHGGVRWTPPFAIGALVVVVVAQALQLTRFARLRELPPRRLYTPVVLFAAWWLLAIFPTHGFTPFIYFQF